MVARRDYGMKTWQAKDGVMKGEHQYTGKVKLHSIRTMAGTMTYALRLGVL